MGLSCAVPTRRTDAPQKTVFYLYLLLGSSSGPVSVGNKCNVIDASYASLHEVSPRELFIYYGLEAPIVLAYSELATNGPFLDVGFTASNYQS